MEEEPQHLNQTINVDAPIQNIVDETTQVGKDGLRPPKKTNIRMMKKNNKVNGKNNNCYKKVLLLKVQVQTNHVAVLF